MTVESTGVVTRQGNYAGAISRLAAFAADVGIAWVAILLILALISTGISIVIGHAVNIKKLQWLFVGMLVVWYPIYFAYQWSLSGKTLGMALFGVRVVSAEGRPITTRSAVIRTIFLPVSLFFFGLGLVGIVLRVDHRGWHDRVAGTCVVYDWDARAARLRWLARQHDFPAARSSATPAK